MSANTIDELLIDLAETVNSGGHDFNFEKHLIPNTKAKLLAHLESQLPEKEDLSLWDSYPEKQRYKFHRYIKAKTRNDTLEDCRAVLTEILNPNAKDKME